MTPLSVTTWKWRKADGTELFTAEHVNTLRSMLERHLHMPFRLHCVTDNPTGVDGDVKIIPLEWYTDTPRCRRRMVQYADFWRLNVGERFLNLDLDVVITDDVTPLFNVEDKWKFWKVGYAGVYSGSVQLLRTGLMHDLWERYDSNQESFPGSVGYLGTGTSDQGMLNYYLSGGDAPPHWNDSDGIYPFFGKGYERFTHLGVSPSSERLPEGCRLVVMGSEDLRYLKELPCLSEHYR